MFLFSSGKYQEMELLDHMVVLVLIFSITSITVFHSGCTNLHSYQQCTKVPFSSHSHQRLLFLVFLMIASLTGVWWYLTVIFICSPLMRSDVEYLFMYLLAHLYVFFVKNVYSDPLPTFKPDCLFFCYWIVWVPYIFWILIPYQIHNLKILFPTP